MTSLDKALIKVYEHGHAPKQRRAVEPTEEQSTRELYVDPPVDELPSPAIAHQASPEEVNELIAPESEIQPPIEETIAESASFVMGDVATSLESFVVQQDFDIPVFGDIGTIVADPETRDDEEKESAQPHFSPAWEVDSFELPESTVRMNDELREQLTDFVAHLRQTTSHEKKLVTVHSQSRGEGRTTLAITLAAAVAQAGGKVLLVDADFENPVLANRLGLAVEVGWERAIAGEVPIAECSVRSIGDAFTILPLSEAAAGEDHSILRDALRNLLSQLVVDFDLILVDSGPGQPLVAENFDSMIATRIAVRDVRRTDSRLMLQFMTSLKTDATQSIEAIDNFA